MENESEDICYIPDGENGYIPISNEEFLKRFPNERSYIEYLKKQGGWDSNEATGNEISAAEFLELARFIYDEPEMRSIPILDIGVRIYSLNMKIKHGIETSKIACEKIKKHNPAIPCTPYPENIFWAKLKGVKPLQFLEPSFNEEVTIDEAIKFGIAEKFEIDATWAKYKLFSKEHEKQQQESTSMPGSLNESETMPAIATIAGKYLHFMRGANPKNRNRIISEAEYKRLLEYVCQYFETWTLPRNIKPVSEVDLTKDEILYTFYLLFRAVRPKGQYPFELFVFISEVISKLHDETLTEENYKHSYIYKKFRRKPTNYDSLNPF